MMMDQIISFLVLISCLLCGTYGRCKLPPPSSNFTLDGYQGLWYEVGKYQTAGGAAFEKDCVCTSIDVQPKVGQANGDCTAFNSCRKKTPTGEFLNATGQLIEMSPPGKWKEQFFVFVPKVDYTVVYLDDQFAIEYDCSVLAGLVTNYCVHLMARTPNPDQARIKDLLTFVQGLGLNTDNLPYLTTLQDQCWNTQY